MAKSAPIKAKRPIGIHTVEDIRNRCKDEDGHWIWQLSRQGKDDEEAGTPMCHFQGKRHAARRVAWILAGKPLKADHVITSKCAEWQCVNPDHLTILKRGAMVQRLGRLGVLSRPDAIKAKAKANKPRRKLTDDQVRAVLADTRRHHVIAAEYGVARPVIGLIKSRKSYRDVVVGGDVFSLATFGLFTRLAGVQA